MLNQENIFKISVIGKSGHAGRIIELLKHRKDVHLQSVYYPEEKKAVNDLPVTAKLEDLLLSDAIVIASPTHTHAEYLDSLKDYQGYILIEKPIVSTEQETMEIRNWPAKRKERIMADFNLRYSKLADILKRIVVMPEMGSLISLEVHTSQGLAFQPSYRDSWRSDIDRSFGVMELVGVHFIDLASVLFGEISGSDADCYVRSEYQVKVPDTIFISLRTKRGIRIDLAHSYAGPYYNHILLMGTNGYWEYDGREAKLYSPRDTFDKNGRFAAPPLIEKVELDYAELWKESLSRSIDDFLNTVKAGGKFSANDFDLALSSMEPIFKAKKVLK